MTATTGGSNPSSKTPTPPPTSRMDTHPFTRKSVIEVLHSFTRDPNNSQICIDPIPKLADIIDYAAIDASKGQYRYYIHYRDYNRRMDEWVAIDRIVSPPSVGNAKAKALETERKKEEARRKRKEEEQEMEELAAEGERARTRRQKRSRSSVGAAGEEDVTEQEFPRGSGSGALDIVETIAAEEMDEHEGLDDEALKEHEEVTKVKNVAEVEFGQFRMEAWYFSPLPKELLKNGFIDILYICEFSMNMFARKSELLRYQAKPGLKRYPPGNEIYRNGNLAMFEVDGSVEKVYCQNLCYLAKLFLDHKTLFYDVDPFLFYVLCEIDDRGYHPVGYFSKEKYSDVGYNLACILTFPSHQRKGYGRFLIAFSYELTKKEHKVGSPEKPMSDLGQQAYKPYWTSTLVDYLRNRTNAGSLSIMDISKETSIISEDVIFTLNLLGLLKVINGVYFIAADKPLLDKLAEKHPIKDPIVDPSKLHWTPYLTDVKRDKFSILSKKQSIEGSNNEEQVDSGGFP